MSCAILNSLSKIFSTKASFSKASLDLTAVTYRVTYSQLLYAAEKNPQTTTLLMPPYFEESALAALNHFSKLQHLSFANNPSTWNGTICTLINRAKVITNQLESIDLSGTIVSKEAVKWLQTMPKLQSVNLHECTDLSRDVSWLQQFIEEKPSEALVAAVVENFKSDEALDVSSFGHELACYFQQIASAVWRDPPSFELDRIPLYRVFDLAYQITTLAHSKVNAFSIHVRDNIWYLQDRAIIWAKAERQLAFHGEGGYKKIIPAIEIVYHDVRTHVERQGAYALFFASKNSVQDWLAEVRMHQKISAIPCQMGFKSAYGDSSFFQLFQYRFTGGVFVQAYPQGDLWNALFRYRFSFEMKRDIMASLLIGLYYLHANGIIHGDIKAANVLLSLDKRRNRAKAVFADFSFSFHKGTERGLFLCGLYGTPEYAPIECIGNIACSHSYEPMEVAALGGVFYHLLSQEIEGKQLTQTAWAEAFNQYADAVVGATTTREKLITAIQRAKLLYYATYEKLLDAVISLQPPCLGSIMMGMLNPDPRTRKTIHEALRDIAPLYGIRDSNLSSETIAEALAKELGFI